MSFLFSNTVLSWGVLWAQPLLVMAFALLFMRVMGRRADALVEVSIRLVRFMDRISVAIIEAAKWLAPIMALTVAALVITRYVFGISAIKPQESVIYMHALLFLLAAPATLLTNGHVRVDIYYAKLSEQGQAIVDLLGASFLLIPVSILIFKYGGSYAARAWIFHEGSAEANGLQAVYLLKTAIPVFAALMMAQGSAMALRAALCLYGAPMPAPQSVEEHV
ncbi:MAG: TRAP transporter small permease subunit [Robiginitomaculum sp.]|nr:TRAP transporter small permease subunit [Robiginitomaculum sp.]MDQ7078261.1 TRAP transporter small permease subunit [Robiginitomaculum sp.]